MPPPRSAPRSAVAPTARCPDCDGRGLVLAPYAAWLPFSDGAVEPGGHVTRWAALGQGVFGESASPRVCHGCRGAGRYDSRSGAKISLDLD